MTDKLMVMEQFVDIRVWGLPDSPEYIQGLGETELRKKAQRDDWHLIGKCKFDVQPQDDDNHPTVISLATKVLCTWRWECRR